MASIKNDEWLAFMDQLHNTVRNSEGIKLTGMVALNEINNFLVIWFAEKIGEKNDNGKQLYELEDRCKFSWLYNQYATDEKISEDNKMKKNMDEKTNHKKLWYAVYKMSQKENEYCVLQTFVKYPILKRCVYDDISKLSVYASKSDASRTIQSIFNMIHKKLNGVEIDHEFFDAFGSAYERFKTDSVGAEGKKTGQHFTPTSIKQYIVNEIDPQYDETIYEPCAGSGGFIHTICSYIRKHDVEYADKFKKNIYANECNPEIIKPLMINMLLHKIPVSEDEEDANKTAKVEEMDSLSSENCKRYHNKFDIIVTNPPFGMSVLTDPIGYPEHYWDVLQSGKNIIKDSSGQFMIHIYNSLKHNGRCGVVIDRGILNNGNGNGWQCKLRKFLIKNADVYKIVLLPTGIFTYTNFATAIIFFIKGEKTKEVKIFEGKFVDEKKKSGLMINEKKPVKVFSYKELKKNGFSLKVDYQVESIIDLTKEILLKDIVDFLPNSDRNASFGKDTGLYNFYTSSSKIKRCDECDYEQECIILGTGGSPNIKMDKNFSCSDHNIIFMVNNGNLKYIYYYLYINIKILNDGFHGNGLKNLSKKYVETIKIRKISDEHQQEIVTILDELFKNKDINKITEVIKDMPLFDLLIKKRYEDFMDAIHLIYRKIETDENTKKMEHDKKASFRWMLNGIEGKEVKLGEICEFKRGKVLSSEQFIIGEYPVIGGGRSPAGYHNEFNMNKNTILCSSSGSYAGYMSKYNTKVWASDCFAIIPNNDIDNEFLFLQLICEQDNIYKKQHGQGQPHVNCSDLTYIKFKKIEIQKQNELIEKMKEYDSDIQYNKNYGIKLQEQIDGILNSIKIHKG